MQNASSLENIIKRALGFYAYSRNPSTVCPIFPDHLHIEPTNACNLRCVHCHQSSAGSYFTKRRGQMCMDLYSRVIDEIAPLSSRITLDAQGEPLLHPRTLDMIAYAKEQGLSVSILTNATRLTEEKAERILELETDRVVFSFEGSSQDIYQSVRRRSRYYPTLRNVLYFIKRNYERGRKTFICMSMVEHRYTRDDVAAYRCYFEAFPIDTVFVNPFLTMSGASLLAKDEVDMQALTASEQTERIICRLPWENFVVNWDGTVSPCAVDYNQSHTVGDANTEHLLDIWNGERMKRFRKCHLEHDFGWIERQGELCQSCNCRFQEDYNLLDLQEFVAHYILRQTQVHQTKLLQECEAGHHSKTDDVRYENVSQELERVDRLLSGMSELSSMTSSVSEQGSEQTIE